MKNKVINIKSTNEVNVLILLFFVVTLAEVIAEFFSFPSFIYLLKPLICPILIVIYWKSSVEKNNYFILALIFGFTANIFFIAKDFSSILLGSLFFMFYRILIIYLVIKIVKVKNYLPVFLGIIPFAIVFLYVTSLTIDMIRDGFYIYIMQVLLMSFLGGFSLANYIIDNNKMNFWLLLSSILFTLIQFIITLKLYYINMFIFQPIAMLFYAIAQFSLYKFMILSEKN
jgi:hypothetical protein